MFAREKKTGDGVASGVGCHHSGADELNMAATWAEGGDPAWVESFGLNFGDEAKAGLLSGGKRALAVVNLRHHPT